MRQLLNPKIALTLITSVVLLLTSCNMKRKSSGDGPQDGAVLEKTTVEEKVREFVYPLPTAFEVTEMLNRIGAAYILTLSNPVSNVERYLTEKSKALNLGIYSADLSYASAYNQKQSVIDYMDVSKKLIDALNISGAISQDVIEQVEANQDNKDELVNIITNTFYDTYEYLNQANRGSVSLLVLAGTWVEGLYIVTHITENVYYNKEMVTIIMKQKASLDTLMELMQVAKDDPAVAETISELLPLYNTYLAVENDAITEAQVLFITKEIYRVRNKMVE
ncbi:hypothetical protein [Xiashengella succiniciproducens]|jgi:hypothetical protein|uniref:Lipoprotein n=1 Tax=Xiashengella succiniciproducens TaxID=2949635 RepID=A0A9J6ZRU7_9BACT|nr:hypothetical protein [Alkaliflexus sp. Ai-910]URW79952.1 hypothetical protein M9189_01085 [Alkaliflexus sp. Ai-910]